MENKIQLLEQLGFSKKYLEVLNLQSDFNNGQQIQVPLTFIENQIPNNDLTSFIIDKSEKPMSVNFIYNGQ
jgi:hypothetical protein